MNITLAASLVVGSAVAACGVLAVLWRRSLGESLVALPILAAGGAICLAGASRFAALRQDPLTGQEMAIMVSLVALSGTLLGTAWIGRGTGR
jgi:NADH:ubiquinone oxidoreductase subunit K